MILTRRAVVTLLVVLPIAASVAQDGARSPVDICGGGGDHAVIEGQVFESGDDSFCNAELSITLGPSVTFQAGSTTMLEAPLIKVLDDVDALSGATLEFRHKVVARVPKTGQTTCYDEDGFSKSCVGSGQDGELQKGAAWPVPRFVVNGNGTVTDNLTGLIWMRDPECLGAYEFPNTLWTDALDDAASMASGQCGLTDGSKLGQWRIPNIREIVSLMHFGFAGPALPNTAGTGQWQDEDPFTGVRGVLQGAPDTYWASTAYQNRSDLLWIAGLYDGRPLKTLSSQYKYVWMVRGETTATQPAGIPMTGQANSLHAGDDGALKKGIPWPVPRFTDNLNGTITDNLTTLVWLKDADCWATRATWETALSRVNALAAPNCGLTDGSTAGDWRLPNVLEYMSLMHYAYGNRSLPDTAGTGQWSYGDPFYDVADLAYWTSTSRMEDPSRGWYVEFKYGEPGFFPKTALGNVWAVRDGD